MPEGTQAVARACASVQTPRTMLRFLLLRFLPRRILPLLALYELYRLVRRLRSHPIVRRPRRMVVSGEASPANVKTLAPAAADGQVYGV